MPGVSNYFIGNDPRRWRTGVPNYARIRYTGVYPGIDMICYGKSRQLEYDLVVASGADPRRIELAWEGVDQLKLNAQGDLVLATRLGEIVQKRPRVYQDTGGRRAEVAANYVLRAGRRVTFELARYDRSRPLVIDPVMLVYSTYLGGTSNDSAFTIAVDGTGAAYVAGYTFSPNFPTVSAYQRDYRGNQDIFVSKLLPSGNTLAYSTYLGGSGEDEGVSIAVDGTGSVYVAGDTTSTDFPTQTPYQSSLKGGEDVFVTRLAPAGNALSYSTYLGGSSDDWPEGIAVDSAGSAYIAGSTFSTNFPTQTPFQGALTSGQDILVTKPAPAGNALVYSTYLGGSGEDLPIGIAIDAARAAYITGYTTSPDFPTQSAFQASFKGGPTQNRDAFVTKFAPAGNALVYSTYLGGSGDDMANYIAVDAVGAAYVAGYTTSTNFPTQSPYQSTNKANISAGGSNAFVTKLQLPAIITTNPAGLAIVVDSLSQTAPQAFDWAPGASHSISVTSPQGSGGTRYAFTNWSDRGGQTHSITAPSSVTTHTANFSTQIPSTPTITSVNNGASHQPGIEAGSWVEIRGANLANIGPDGRIWRPDEIVNGNFPTSLDGVSVTIDGKPAYVYYISPAQVNVQAPADSATGPVSVVVTNNGSASAPGTAQLQPYAPAFFQWGATNYAIATRYCSYSPQTNTCVPDTSVVLIGNPSAVPGTVAAKPSDILIFWGTGFGPTIPPVPAGQAVGTPASLVSPVMVTVGGTTVEMLGAALSYAGEYQIAVRLPASIGLGDQPVQASIAGYQSPARVSLFIASQ